MNASFPSLPLSLLRAVMALAVLAGLLLGMAHPPAPPQPIASAVQTAILELGGGTFGPSGHVLAKDFRQVQHRPGESTAPGDGDVPFLMAAAISAMPLPAPAQLFATTIYVSARQTPSAYRPTGPPSLVS